MVSNELYRRAINELLSENRTAETSEAMVREAFAGNLDEVQMTAWLTALHARGEMAEDLIPAVRWVRERMIHLRTPPGPVIDTCGTGGDHSGTFNISTAAAFVVAGAGVTVVKHGNRSFSSKTGSADVLQVLGVPIDKGVEWAQKCIDDIGFAFCFAPQFHPAMAQFGPIRKRIGFRTLFNLIGPLANPASAQFQLIGVSDFRLKWVLQATVAGLDDGTIQRKACIVRGGDDTPVESGLWIDEVSLAGPTEACIVRGAKAEDVTWQPEDFGLERVMIDEIQAADSTESAGIIDRILRGEPGPAARICMANAAAALFTAGQAKTLLEGVELSKELIRSGKALSVLEKLRAS